MARGPSASRLAGGASGPARRPSARMGPMETMPDELTTYLAALDRDSCYRVDAVYKEGGIETTQRVFFRGDNGAELGPFVRKLIARDAGVGAAYELLYEAQRRGVRLAHLPRIVECHRTETHLVVVMEHAAGETLASRVGRASTSAERLELARRAFPDLCDAVSELHERLAQPVIHRDLKPGNVMVSEGGVTLIDLGIAREYKEGAPQDTMRFGTRAYAPPEQFGFGQTSVQSDVYALGMLLFFCLTGREPTSRDREGGFAAEGVPGALRETIARATRLDPAMRHASVRGLREEVLAALGEGDADALPQMRGPLPPPRVARSVSTGTVPTKATARPARRGATLASRGSSLLARVPRPLGIVWDLLVLATCALFFAACVASFVSPSPRNAVYPTWYLALSYLGCLGPAAVVAAYLLLDRRPLRARVPVLARLTVARETRAGLLAIGALLLLWIAATVVVTFPG